VRQKGQNLGTREGSMESLIAMSALPRGPNESKGLRDVRDKREHVVTLYESGITHGAKKGTANRKQ